MCIRDSAQVAGKVLIPGERALDARGGDLQKVALGDGVGLVQQVADPAAHRLAGVEVDPLGAVDDPPQEPVRPLFEIEDVPEFHPQLLADGLDQLAHPVGGLAAGSSFCHSSASLIFCGGGPAWAP